MEPVMQNKFLSQIAFLLSLLILVSICVVDASAQRRKRRARRVTRHAVARPVITNPTIAPAGAEQPSGTESEKIISTADQNTNETEQNAETTQPKRNKKSSDD